MPTRFPALAAGSRIRLIAPASAFPRDAFEQGVEWLRAQGYEPSWEPDVHERQWYFARSPRRRAAELQRAFEDPEVDAIMAIRGGWGSMTLLPWLDFDAIAAHPKPLIGMSDITSLLIAIEQRCGFPTFHGPMVGRISHRVNDDSRERFLAMVGGARKPAPLKCGGDGYWFCLSPGVARGRATGGNLSLVVASLGTPWEIDTEGKVLFLEEVGEKPHKVDRMVSQLVQAGKLEHCAGVVFGLMMDCEPAEGAGYQLRDLVQRSIRRLPLPVLWGAPFGHGDEDPLIPIGCRVSMNASLGTVQFRENPFKA